MSSSKPTLRDIADATGLSISTVSRALRGHESINAETRRQVEREATRINYSASVRSEREGVRKGMVLESLVVVLRDPHMGRFFGDSVLALLEIGQSRGFSVEIVQSDARTELAKDLLGVTADAAVVFSMGRVDFAEQTDLLHIKTPFVIVNRHGEDTCNSVTLDDFSAGFKAARYLYELGHRRIGYMPGSWMGTATRERHMGFRAGLETYGCYDAEFFAPADGGDVIEPVRAHVKKLLGMNKPATALATYNDGLAVAALMAVREAGLRIPEDFSVIGFDNNPEFKGANLTTFDYRYRDLAEHAVYMLDGLISGEIQGPTRVALMPHLVQGKTAGPAPAVNNRAAV